MSDLTSHLARRKVAPRRDAAAGFALLELLLAMTVASVVAGVLYASLGIAFGAREAATQEVGTLRAAVSALDAIGRDLGGVQTPTGILAGGFVGTDAQADAGDADTITCFTNNPFAPSAAPMGELYQVELALISRADFTNTAWLPGDADDTDVGQFLIRTVTVNLLASGEAVTTQQLLADRVISFNTRYSNGSDWSDDWDSSTQDDSLPNAVELTLTVLPKEVAASDDDVEDQTRTVRRVVALLSAPSATQRETEAAGG